MPFPRFDPKDERHQRLATVSKEAAEHASRFLSTADLSDISMHRLGTLRLEVKRHLAEAMKTVDMLVEQITETM